MPPSDPTLRLLHGDTRWLTQIGGLAGSPVAVVVPRVGEPIAVAQGAAAWLEFQPWLSDMREAASDFAGAVRVVLRELPLRERRVGIARLGSSIEDWDAVPSDAFLRSLAAAFPGVAWVDFSAPLDALRATKSAEELAFLERSVAIVDDALAEIRTAVRPGVPISEPWGALVEAICRAGSDLPPPPRWAMPPSLPDLTPRPIPDPIAPGALFLLDAQAAWGGYHAWGAQSFSCAQQDDRSHELMQALATAWHDAVGMLAPGRSLDDVHAAMLATIRAAAVSRMAREARWRLILRGCGLGGDLPRRQPAPGSSQQMLLSPGCCLAVGLAADCDSTRLIWGDSVVLTATGARRLGRRELTIAVSGAPA